MLMMMMISINIAIGTARVVCVSVRLSVCPIRPLQQRAAGLLLWARRAGDIDRLLHGRRHSSTGPQHGKLQKMRAVPLFLANVGS